jgi:hypothetical protein
MRLYWAWHLKEINEPIEDTLKKFESICHEMFPKGTIVEVLIHIPTDFERLKFLDAFSVPEEKELKDKFEYNPKTGMASRGTFISNG